METAAGWRRLAWSCTEETGRHVQLFASEVEFDRSVPRIARGTRNIRTIILSVTVREVAKAVFQGSLLRSAVLSEGQERIGRIASRAVRSGRQRCRRRCVVGNDVFLGHASLRRVHVEDHYDVGLSAAEMPAPPQPAHHPRRPSAVCASGTSDVART